MYFGPAMNDNALEKPILMLQIWKERERDEKK